MRFGWLTIDSMRVPVWVNGERNSYGRSELRVTPAGGEGPVWVTAQRVIIPEGLSLPDDAAFARELSARIGSVALMRDAMPLPPRAKDARTQALFDELKRGGVTPATDEEMRNLRGIPS